ncbi:ArnT family glycosyltransferase [Pseudonocardia sp. CA-107938]|uniref:ArnT family glycosyltransferase n=1 Tax=Pseudonocardia sp. CA-107938 TaxID=3240021 RepID=UPI003D93C32F
MTATLDRPTASAVEPTRRSRGEHGALAALLLGTGVLYLWNLSANGWANDFYATAVRSMTLDWKAFFFASLDVGGTVTVDKPPAALWVMALSGRIFGFSSWSMLVPQALMGVATVALLYAAVRRVAGPRAGLIAGAVLALTPVAALMFRFNNPDALLVLLMVAAAYATVRAIEQGGTRWLLLAGFLLGFGFLAKMLQAFVVLPALALAFLVAAPTGIWKRVWQLLAAGGAVVVGSGWWIAIAELWPAASRPYIGGSTTNSVLQLALGYNGLGRIFGGERGGGTRIEIGTGPAPRPGMVVFGPEGPMGGGGFGGEAGLQRLFNGEIGGQATWLLPAALVLLVAGSWLAWRHREVRGSLVLWGGWTVLTFLVFSLAEGIFHPYYTVALAPGIAALVGIGGALLWRERSTWWVRGVLALVVAGTGAWAFVLLDRSPQYLPWLRWVVVAAAVLGAVGVLAGLRARAFLAGTLAAVAVAGLAGPTAYTLTTVTTSHVGGIPSAGPPIEEAGRDRGQRPPGDGQLMRGPGMMEPGTVDPAVVALLQSAGTDWSAATVGSQGAGRLALASDTDVMPIGGFSGGDPAPTLEQFQADVAAGRIHWFVTGGERGGPGGGRGTGKQITEWVQQNFTAQTIGGQEFYDLTAAR